MSPLDQAKQWLGDEKPTQEEIQQSVDNLCHQIPRPPQDVSEEQLMTAILYLMGVLGKDSSELVLPETSPKVGLDLSPLGALPTETITALSCSERRKRFEQLKEDLRSPF